MRKIKYVISCEHASNALPSQYRSLFQGKYRLLQSHRAYDKGALAIARGIERKIGNYFIAGRFSRLVIDLNRSLNNRRLFTCLRTGLSVEERNTIIDRYYLPYHAALDTAIEGFIRSGYRVIHVSVHSFTPVLKGKKRRAALGILYDPSHLRERVSARIIKQHCRSFFQPVRMNYPYKGSADGTTSRLRKYFSEDHYQGIELEFDQHLIADATNRRLCITDASDALLSLT